MLARNHWSDSLAATGSLRTARLVSTDRALAIGLLFVVLAVGTAELVLIELKYRVLFGGWLQPYPLVAPLERASFVSLVLLLDGTLAALAATFWVLLAGRRPRRTVLFALDYVILAGGAAVALLIGRYELLNVLGDMAGFELIRRLGGGSLTDALLFAFDEISLFALAIVGFAAAWLGVRWLLVRLLPARMLAAGPPPRPAVWVRWTALSSAASACLLLLVGGVPSMRLNLEHSLGYMLVNSVLEEVTDIDRDGYGPFSLHGDPYPFDARSHPLALDVPGDGIDQDGYEGDMAPPSAAELARLVPSRDWTFPAGATRPHLILVVLESVRADMLDADVGSRPVTPNLRARAARGTVGTAYAHEAFTVQALKAIMTGRHGVVEPDASLFAILRRNGYRTAVFSGQDESFGGIAAETGMDRDGTPLVDARTLLAKRAFWRTAQGALRIDGRVLLKQIESTTLSEPWDGPHFLYVNFQEAHFPYHHEGMPQLLPGRPVTRFEFTAANRDRVRSTYLNAVANADARLGELLGMLERKGVLEKSLVVVVGDHGESLFDGGLLGHGLALNDVQTRPILVFSKPGLALPPVVGQERLKDIILATMGAHRTDGPGGLSVMEARQVFQIIGPLERPMRIGLVEPDGTRTVIDTERRRVLLGEGERWLAYDVLTPDDPVRARVADLVREWELRRWFAAAGLSAAVEKPTVALVGFRGGRPEGDERSDEH